VRRASTSATAIGEGRRASGRGGEGDDSLPPLPARDLFVPRALRCPKKKKKARERERERERERRGEMYREHGACQSARRDPKAIDKLVAFRGRLESRRRLASSFLDFHF